jgi:hypothetical protein
MTAKQMELKPGGIIDLDDINDLQPLVTPDMTASTYQSEMLCRDYADRVSGANDPMSGYADPVMKSGADVSSTLFLAEQGNSILNAIYDGIENDYNEIGQLVLMQLVSNKDRVDLSMLSAEEAALVRQVLNMPPKLLPNTFSFRVSTTDQSRSEETKRQTLAQASGLYAQYGQQMMQLAPIIDSPQSSPTMRMMATKLFAGGTRFVRDAMTMMKVKDVDTLFPDTTEMEGAQDGTGAVAGAGNGLGGGMGGSAGGMPGATGGVGMVPPTAASSA